MALRAASDVTVEPQGLQVPLLFPPIQSYHDIAKFVRDAQLKRLADVPIELEKAREIGTALFDALFPPAVLSQYRAALRALEPGQRLRVRLRTPQTLRSVPWELLYDLEAQQFLALSDDATLIRYPEVPQAIAPLRLEGPLQLVVVLASPKKVEEIDLDLETKAKHHILRFGRSAIAKISHPSGLMRASVKTTRIIRL